MPLEVVAIDSAGFTALSAEILAVYAEAFAAPPYRYSRADVTAFESTLRVHTRRDGFKACVAQTEQGVIGFTYGYTGAPGQWWHDFVSAGMSRELAAQWMADSFEFVELAVKPESQGLGAGRRLHDLLVHDLPHRTSVLSTAQEQTVAQRMYLASGWQLLVDGFRFPSRPHAYRILGLALR